MATSQEWRAWDGDRQNRLGEPRDIAAMAAWLVEPDNDWITGQVFTVDNGRSIVRAIGKL